MAKLDIHTRKFLRNYQATPEWMEWAAFFDQRPEYAYRVCPRGDWILRVAEEYGVPRRELVQVALPLVEEYLSLYQTEGVAARALSMAKLWAEGAPDDCGSHKAGHEGQAASRLVDACAHLAHASGHTCVHAAQALECLILAAEQADFGLGREKGRQAAEARTAGYVRERLPLSRILNG